MSRSEVVNEAPSRNRPGFAATFAPAALLGGLGCVVTATLLFVSVPLSLYIVTDAVGAGAAVAFVVALVALPGYLRGQYATNYSRRVDEARPEPVRQLPRYVMEQKGPVARSHYEIPREPSPGMLAALAEYIVDAEPDVLSERVVSRVRGDAPAYQGEAWEKLRDWLVERGFVEWVNPANPKQSVRLTDDGRDWFERLVVEDE